MKPDEGSRGTEKKDKDKEITKSAYWERETMSCMYW